MPETAIANVLEADGAVRGLFPAGDPFGLLSALSKQVQSDRTRLADPAEVRHADPSPESPNGRQSHTRRSPKHAQFTQLEAGALLSVTCVTISSPGRHVMRIASVTMIGQFPDGIDLHVRNLLWAVAF